MTQRYLMSDRSKSHKVELLKIITIIINPLNNAQNNK